MVVVVEREGAILEGRNESCDEARVALLRTSLLEKEACWRGEALIDGRRHLHRRSLHYTAAPPPPPPPPPAKPPCNMMRHYTEKRITPAS